VSVAFKNLLRYDELKRCLYGNGLCEAFPEYVRFYVEGRKKYAMGYAFLEISRPAKCDPGGVYFIDVWAGEYFRTGHVLTHFHRRAGEADRTRPTGV
jgi:hypothetical protein